MGAGQEIGTILGKDSKTCQLFSLSRQIGGLYHLNWRLRKSDVAQKMRNIAIIAAYKYQFQVFPIKMKRC